MKINNVILVLRTRIILLSSFVIYFFCICHSGRFPIIKTVLKIIFNVVSAGDACDWVYYFAICGS